MPDDHECLARGCAARLPLDRFLCLRHFNALPKPLLTCIESTFRPGRRLTPEFLSSIIRAIRHFDGPNGGAHA